MTDIKKKIEGSIIFILLVSTIANNWFIQDRDVQWRVALVAWSAIPALYSVYFYFKTKSKISLILMFIFAAEFIAALLGWNLNTEWLPEAMTILLATALFLFIKRWLR